MCKWILDFLTNTSHLVKMGNKVSTALTVSTGTLQGCCLNPKLFALYTHDCTSSQDDNIIMKYADDTTILSFIRGGDESSYRELVHKTTVHGEDNDLILNTDKTKELIIDFRRRAKPLQPLTIKDTTVERTDSYKFLVPNISEPQLGQTHCNHSGKKLSRGYTSLILSTIKTQFIH